MKDLSPRREPFDEFSELLADPSATVSYDVYACIPPARLIELARRRCEYRPGDGPKPVLEYACKIAVPQQGFITTENPAPVILAAIGEIIGEDELAKVLSEHFEVPPGWTSSLVQWRGLLARPVNQGDLPKLLDDLSRCAAWCFANAIEEYCKRRGMVP